MPEIQAALAMPWGAAAAPVQAVLSMPWTAAAAPVQSIGGGYTATPAPGGTPVSPGDLRATAALGPAAAYHQVHTQEVTHLRTGATLAVDALGITLQDDSICWELAAEGPDELFAPLTTGEQPAAVAVEIDGHLWHFVVETVARPRGPDSRRVQFSGRSPACVADKPYSLEANYAIDAPTTAAQLCAGALLSAGVDLEWKLEDWLIPAGAITLTGTPMDVVRAVAGAVGGVITAHPSELRITVESRYPVMPNEWAGTPPDVQVHSRAVRTEQIDQADAPAYTGVIVSGQQGGALAYARLEGTSGAELAPLVSDPLLTDAPALRERARSILAPGGGKALVTRLLPVRTGAGEPGVLRRGALLRAVDQPPGGATEIWHAMVRSVAVRATFPQVEQTVTLERFRRHVVEPDTSTALALAEIPDLYLQVNLAASVPLVAYRSGGAAPYRWALRSGALPPGLAIVGEAITGTPTTVGTSADVALRLTDRVARMLDSAPFDIHVVPQEEDLLLWLQFEQPPGTGGVPVDSSPYARVPVNHLGVFVSSPSKCGAGTFGSSSGYRIDYTAAEFPPFEHEAFLIQMHHYGGAAGTTEKTLVARMVNASLNHGWRLRRSAGGFIVFQTWNSSGTQLFSRSWGGLPGWTSEWHHAALWWTGSDLQLWFDGALRTPSSSSGTPQLVIAPGAELHFGWDRNAGIAFNSGYVDEVKVLRRTQLALGVVTACPL